jgi:two-component sensor histidine kinase
MRAAEHQKLLIDELNHRVKNTLATVQSIATQTLRTADTTQDAKDALERRLLALSRAHDVLTRENWEGADLMDVVERALEPYQVHSENRLHITGPHVRLTPRMSLALAMALHELATNAVKYGALSNKSGIIDVSWAVQDGAAPPRLVLQWKEAGGPPVVAPRRRGFGSRLIERSLAQDLDGQVDIAFAPTGRGLHRQRAGRMRRPRPGRGLRLDGEERPVRGSSSRHAGTGARENPPPPGRSQSPAGSAPPWQALRQGHRSPDARGDTGAGRRSRAPAHIRALPVGAHSPPFYSSSETLQAARKGGLFFCRPPAPVLPWRQTGGVWPGGGCAGFLRTHADARGRTPRPLTIGDAAPVLS